MLLINREAAMQCLSMEECIYLMRELFRELDKGNASDILRTVVRLPENRILGLMPAYIEERIAGVKAITVFHDNNKRNYPSHQGAVLIYDLENGEMRAVVDAQAVTAIRTAAVSAVATDLLARRDAQVLTLLGAGVQARSHLESIMQVRNIYKVNVWSRRHDDALRFKQEMEKAYDVEIIAVKTGEEACKEADIVCTLTASKEPILFHSWLKKGAHINAIGACTPDAREVDTEIIRNSKIYVDSRTSASNEAGDLLIPLKLKEIQSLEQHIAGGLSDIINKNAEEIRGPEDITVFESLGLAAEDVICSEYAYRKAAKLSLGVNVKW